MAVLLTLSAVFFTGLGQYTDAQQLISQSYQGLKSSLGETSEVAGESKYYLALMTLLTADSEEAVAQADPMLLQVGVDTTRKQMKCCRLAF